MYEPITRLDNARVVNQILVQPVLRLMNDIRFQVNVAERLQRLGGWDGSRTVLEDALFLHLMRIQIIRLQEQHRTTMLPIREVRTVIAGTALEYRQQGRYMRQRIGDVYLCIAGSDYMAQIPLPGQVSSTIYSAVQTLRKGFTYPDVVRDIVSARSCQRNDSIVRSDLYSLAAYHRSKRVFPLAQALTTEDYDCIAEAVYYLQLVYRQSRKSSHLKVPLPSLPVDRYFTPPRVLDPGLTVSDMAVGSDIWMGISAHYFKKDPTKLMAISEVLQECEGIFPAERQTKQWGGQPIVSAVKQPDNTLKIYYPTRKPFRDEWIRHLRSRLEDGQTSPKIEEASQLCSGVTAQVVDWFTYVK